jgi:hypothetical protein
MTKQILSLLAVLIPSLSLAPTTSLAKMELSCPKNPVYCKILALSPKVNKAFAAQLSNLILKYSKIYHTNPMHSVAIAMQESGFENKNRMGVVMDSHGRLVHGVTDVGVFQIHVATIAYLGIDVKRLARDVEYQTMWHTKILASKIKTCTAQGVKLGVTPGSEWACYHSFTPAKRAIYVQDVGAHMSKLAHFNLF